MTDTPVTREIPLSEALELVGNYDTPAQARILEALSAWSGPFLVYDGEVRQGGNLEVGTRPTIVWGDLHVGGTVLDRASGQLSLLIVLGDMKARNVVTRGDICIAGDLRVRDTIYGSSSGKHTLVVGGTIDARAIVNHGHWFHLEAGAAADFVFGHIENVEHSGFQSTELFISEVLDVDGEHDEHFDAALKTPAIVEKLARGDDVLRENPTTRRQKMMHQLDEPSESEEKKVIHLEDAGLMQVPDEVFETPGLEKLVLDYNDIASLPPRIGELRDLRYLSVDGAMMRRLPEEIGDLDKLEVLSLRFVRLKTLPSSLAGLENLRELYLTYSSLTSFPEVLTQLPSLEKLIFWHCQPDDAERLGTFLEGVAPIESLQVLGFIQGELRSFPGELAKVDQIHELQVADLALGDQEIAEIHRMLPRVKVKTSL